MNPVHIFTPNLFKMCFNFILPSTPQPTMWYFSFMETFYSLWNFALFYFYILCCLLRLFFFFGGVCSKSVTFEICNGIDTAIRPTAWNISGVSIHGLPFSVFISPHMCFGTYAVSCTLNLVIYILKCRKYAVGLYFWILHRVKRLVCSRLDTVCPEFCP
jgi:hypothetical protein